MTMATPTTLTIDADAPPLRVQDGMIIIVGTRVPIDIIIWAYLHGDSPEKIAEEYSSLSLADVYASIAYYLRHREKLDAYVAKREREALELKKQIESQPGYQERRERLLQRGRERGLIK